jgi:hypothetical protein
MGGTFSADISKFVIKAKGNAEIVVKNLAFAMFSRVQTYTPKDTHRAITGWQPTVNSPGGSDPGPGNYPMPPAPIIPAFRLGDSIFYCNNVHYIPYLEYGTAPYGFSRQAPAGMVRITITEYQAFLAKAVASLG